MVDELSALQHFSVWIVPVVLAITVHEVAHGWVAKQLGDPTAQRLGRLTLNPIKHVDPMGTLLIPGVLLLFGGLIFGWAKPVPVTWENLRHPKRDMALVAAAGPGVNLLMALLWAGITKGASLMSPDAAWFAVPLGYMGAAGIHINIVLAVLNLLPIPPLDGGRVAAGLLPGPMAYQLSRVEPYGFFILIALMFTPVLGYLIGPPIMMLKRLVVAMVGG